MWISPKYTDEDWKNITFSNENDWSKAIGIFEDRIHHRFLDVVSKIEKLEYAGFAILALDCLLIETLQQFREGKDDTPRREAEDYFVKFLTGTGFRSYFNEQRAKMFYDHFRCGILHQAETKCSSLIRTEDVLVKPSDDGKGLVINRRKFHQVLLDEFKNYLSLLRDPSRKDERAKFKKKMDYICRVT